MTDRSSVVPPLVGGFETVVEALDAAAEQFGDREAYVDGDRRLTYLQWQRASCATAALLSERGVAHGDVVSIMLPSSIEYAVVYAACARLGAVASGINPRLGPREVAAIFERSQPRVAVGEPSSPEILIDIPVVSSASIRDLVENPEVGASIGVRPTLRATDPVVIIWTSGTTGLPKGAWFDHRGLHAAVATAGVLAAPFDRRLVATPFAHAGYMAKLWEQAAWGITCVVGPVPWTAVETVAILERERITVAGAVPTQWAKIVELPAPDGAQLGALRIGVAATAPTPPELVQRVTEQIGCALVVRYAMTESPSITGTEPGDAPEVLYRTVGRAQSGVEVEIRDERGQRCADGEVGRVHVRSPGAMRGYWNDPEQSAEVLSPEGWIRSGDLGSFDDAGNLVLVGRAGDMYIRGGYNVYPLEVENVLAEHPGVEQAAVIGVATPVIGEIGVAFVVAASSPYGVTTSAAPTLAELRAWCQARLADYKAPDELHIVDALPLTAMLKVDKSALRDRLDARRARPD
jgi:acyl-CoA synthetase (AMP-forming)/AMP-acid ligase II